MNIQFVRSMYAVAKYVCTYICKNEPFEFHQQVATRLKNFPQDSTERKIRSTIGNILLTHQKIGLQETAYRFIGLEMLFSSRGTIYVDVSLPYNRYRILKGTKQLEELAPGSVDIFHDNFTHVYHYRPI